MSKLNADGTPRKKYVSKKMRLAKNRRNAQKKAWATRRALYPETNGFKPTMVQEEKQEQEEVSYGIRQRQAAGETIVDLEKKLDAADAVNRNLKGMMQGFQVEGAENRIKIAELEKTLKNKQTAPNKLLSSEAHRLRDREVELEEIITALQHDLELAKKAITQMTDGEKKLRGDLQQAVNVRDLYEEQLKDVRKEAQEQVQALNQHNSLLTGELRGANYCFSKLAEEMSKGKEVA